MWAFSSCRKWIYSLVAVMDFLIQQLLLLWCMGFSGCSSWPEIAPQQEEFSWTRDQTCVPCTGRRILIHCATREVLVCLCVLVTQSCPSLWNPIVCPWDSPGKNTGVGCHSLLQGDLPYPGIKPRSPALAGGFFTIWAKCWITLHYEYLPHWLIHLMVNGHLGYFHVLAIVNNAVMNMSVKISLPEYAFNSSGYRFRGGIAESYGFKMFFHLW